MSKINDSIIKQQESNTESLLTMQSELSRLSEGWDKDEPPPEPTQADIDYFNSLDDTGF